MESCIETAKQRGLPPVEVVAIVEHFESKPGAWTPGAICFRIRNGRPGQDPSEGWPKVSDGYKREVRAQDLDKQRQQRYHESGELAAILEQERLDNDQLERECGDEFDKLPEDERLQLAQEVLSLAQLDRYRHDPEGPDRYDVLEAWRERREGAQCPT